jgi:hypothetical protein
VITPETLPEGVRLYDIVTRESTATASSVSYMVIRFFRDGSTDGARLRIIDDNLTDVAAARQVTVVRLNPATGHSSLVTEVR